MENLSELAPIYPNVKILHFHVDIRNNRLDFKVGYLFFFFLDEIQVRISEFALIFSILAFLCS